MKFPIGRFFSEFLAILPDLLPRFALAWLVAFVGLIGTVLLLKKLIHPQVLRTDARIRAWARTLRYQDVTASGPDAAERHARTNFFRFWTNFASAPTLIFLSLATAIWATGNVALPRFFYLPGIAYAGSMLLSFVSKRVFKRARPVREEGAFGHKLKDGSFPSGHSLTSFCFWFTLPVAAGMVGVATSWIALLVFAAFVVVTLTGLSRIYLGVHFPSDVLGGFGIGTAWCLLCYLALHAKL
ncbi:PAP2 superfamily protein [Abditibacterium utsteinense]|uniref:PAP2 superfamily protein n=1 Tax=Abditibacterium utsteinense TaxID=1960156 RepID=A0A2S8SW13_9BACT|nr:phosphatase PAP2 family protein [Abditibacterium utsteinense]PQV64982.1 PAP2 superfamily protein [Abditibacterium utsteinense]